MDAIQNVLYPENEYTPLQSCPIRKQHEILAKLAFDTCSHHSGLAHMYMRMIC